MTTGAEGAVVRLGVSAARPAWRWIRPSVSHSSLAGYADELADDVRRRETALRDQLRAGPTDPNLAVEITVRTKTDTTPVAVARITECVQGLRVRRVLLLGEAGSGKTVAATHLVLGLLDRRRELGDAARAAEPVPVRVNAAGWNGEQLFSRWLAERLGSDYRLHRRVAKALVDAGLILPLVDGLDEMESVEAAHAALARINEVPWRHRPLVVLCRTEDFEELRQQPGGARLVGAATITMGSFSHEQIIGYLKQRQTDDDVADDAWSEVIGQVERESTGPLATALRTPWMLALADTAQRHDPEIASRLARSTEADDVRARLLAEQIPAAVDGRDRDGPYEHYDVDKVTRWLATLARRLDERGATGGDGTTIRLDEVWELAGPVRCRALYGLVCGLVALLGLLPSFLVAVDEEPSWLDEGWWSWLGLAFPLVIAIPVGWLPDVEGRRLAWRIPGRSWWRHALSRLWEPTWLAIIVMVVCGVFAVFADITAVEAVVLVALALPGCLAYALVRVLSVDSADKGKLIMHETRLVRDDATAAAVIGALVAVAIWAGFASADRLGGEPDGSLLAPLYSGGYFGLVAVMVYGVATGRYLTAAVLFSIDESFPDRPARFLEWARRGGLLSVSGDAYQFRHETLREWVKANTPS
ncbi:hypothetical protein AB0H49_09740 [Nocardia sp. NPDC050713]|uniref:NACHT domain-containing protein n=1 Tax=Nocardia sp. NPDC050713 TaxID=3154511 RepID=UPI003402F418